MRNLEVELSKDWFSEFKEEFNSPQMDKISEGIDKTISKHGIESIYPPKKLMFRAFKETPLHNVKIVFLGFEPTKYTASGLFLESTNGEMSPQLRKVIDVMDDDIPNGFPSLSYTGLTRHWANDGVLMLNTALSARVNEIGRHFEHWKFFTEKVLSILISQEKPIAFVGFGITPNLILDKLKLPKHHTRIQFKKGIFIELQDWLKSVGHSSINW